MEKKSMALCTPLPEDKLAEIRQFCDIDICGELKHSKGNVTEEQTRQECINHELVVLGDEYAGADTIKAWADSGMKFLGVAKGTPHMAGLTTDVGGWSGKMMSDEVLAYLNGTPRKFLWKLRG